MELEHPLAAIQMGLIYVNPEGPGGNPDPLQSARDIKITFERMAMNHEETVALTAGGHTFGKAHGAGDASLVGAAPEGGDLSLQGLGWASAYESGIGEHTITSGIEGAWVNTPTQWSENYFRLLLDYEYELVKSPAGAQQWQPINQREEDKAPAAHDPSKRVPTMMTTADMALKMDPEFRVISEKFRNDHEAFKDSFARAWFKLTHRDMGPKVRYLGPEVPAEDLIWQDPVPQGTKPSDADVSAFKSRILDAGFSVGQLVKTAWASGSTFRKSDFRGGANGARVRLAPQKDWAVNEPAELGKVLAKIDELRAACRWPTPSCSPGLLRSKSCQGRRLQRRRSICRRRGDATQQWTDVEASTVMEPAAEGFRNYLKTKHSVKTEELLIDRAQLLGLSASGNDRAARRLRVLGANYRDAPLGVFTNRKGQLTNDFFVNLLDNDTFWEGVDESGR
jgi:catalase-peroxidase